MNNLKRSCTQYEIYMYFYEYENLKKQVIYVYEK